jgi:sec-independent protein translocase protein TatA
MGFGAPIHWIVLLLVVLLLFGSGRLSSLMGDLAKGIKSFKKGMAEDDDLPKPQSRIEAPTDVRTAAERDAERVRDERP